MPRSLTDLGITVDNASDAIIQLGIGGLALWMIFKLLTPVVGALVRAMDAVVGTQKEISTAIVEVTKVIVELRSDLHAHFKEDRQTGEHLKAELRRLQQQAKEP